MTLVMARAASAFSAALAVEKAEGEKTLARATDRLNEATDGMSPSELRTVTEAARRLRDHCEWLLNR